MSKGILHFGPTQTEAESREELSESQIEVGLGVLNSALDSRGMPKVRSFELDYLDFACGGNNNG